LGNGGFQRKPDIEVFLKELEGRANALPSPCYNEDSMQMKLKQKYTCRAEPLSWRNLAGKKNVTQWGSGGGRNNKRKMQKGITHPIGFSGRTMSANKKTFG
jgi:hypothetical protein